MEDIYDHLDNYDDVNALQELRGENHVLKQKLEECTAAMGKLQKDYDDLALEFKKLEMNYSSLLKTARAEIERKTQIITNLNIEKDMMVLKSLQNGNNFRRSFYKGKANMNNANNASKKPDSNKNTEESQKKNTDNINDRKEKSSSKSQEPVTDSRPVETTNTISDKGLANTCTDKKSDCKENVKNEPNPTPKVVACSIRNRRKSMPAECIQKEINNSDDECDRKGPTKEMIKNDIPEKKHLERVPIDRYSNKTSESSSLDDRNSNYQEHTRETQRNRPNRYYDDKYRSRDKYELTQRYRRHNSPDRGHRRPPKEYRDDYHHKSEHGRYRVLVSPPPDYHHNNHMISYQQRRNREPRPNYDRYPNEYDRYRNRHDEKHPYKHKMAYDHDEPSSKRQRIESFSNTGPFRPDEEERYADIEQLDRGSGPGHMHGIQDESCQSPDYIHTEAASAHQVREIMNTATTPLEDPRKCSSKYVLKTDAEGATTISTVTGRNIDIKLIDKPAWNIESVDIPRALKNHPSQFSEEVVNEIYMGIDNPVTNISMESGEICFDSEKLYSENDNYRKTGNEKLRSDLNKPMEEYSKPSQPIANDENIQTSSCTKYRIPKIKHDVKQGIAKLDSYKKVNKPNDEEKKKEEYNSEHCLRDTGRQTNTHTKNYSNESNDNSNILSKTKNGYQSHNTLSIRVVEDDLVLSDENSDIEPNIEIAMEKTKVHDTEKRATEVGLAPSNMNANNMDKLAYNNGENINNQEINASTEKTKETDVRKHKGKKKKSKSKDSKQTPENTDIVQVIDKKTRSKKVKVKPKVMDKKFSDLFGDSGSLIMPEDLGIATYVPSFEETQDAIDLNIKEITKHLSPNVNEDCNGEAKAQSKKLADLNPASNSHENENECGKVHNSDTDKIKTTKRNYEKDFPELPANIVYENLNPDITVENSNVVKTVVISTGVQPQFDMECNVEPDLAKTVKNVESDPNIFAGASKSLTINEFNKRERMKALATSTPHKEFGTPIEIENRVIESRCSRAGSIDSLPSAVDQSERNTLDSITDVPDVRIFVKRRRKVIKKPPAT